MKTEIYITNDDEPLPPDDAFADQWNTTVSINVRLDLWQMLHSELSPEAFLDEFFATTKAAALEHFYNRFPGQRP